MLHSKTQRDIWPLPESFLRTCLSPRRTGSEETYAEGTARWRNRGIGQSTSQTTQASSPFTPIHTSHKAVLGGLRGSGQQQCRPGLPGDTGTCWGALTEEGISSPGGQAWEPRAWPLLSPGRPGQICPRVHPSRTVHLRSHSHPPTPAVYTCSPLRKAPS